jgi:hypothetical protein
MHKNNTCPAEYLGMNKDRTYKLISLHLYYEPLLKSIILTDLRTMYIGVMHAVDVQAYGINNQVSLLLIKENS